MNQLADIMPQIMARGLEQMKLHATFGSQVLAPRLAGRLVGEGGPEVVIPNKLREPRFYMPKCSYCGTGIWGNKTINCRNCGANS